MVDGYVQSLQIRQARHLFDEMPLRDITSWNTLLSGYYKANDPLQVFRSFLEIGRVGLVPNEYTMSTTIGAFHDSKFKLLIPQIHACLLRLGLGTSVFVGSALVKGYANIRDLEALQRSFDDLPFKDISSWNSLLSGYIELGYVEEAERIFLLMPLKNSISWTALLHGYMNRNMVDKARLMFDTMSHTVRNVYSWTAMINGYVKNEKYNAALLLFIKMVNSGAKPNHFTYSCILSACSSTSSLLLGMQVHTRVVKFGSPDSVVMLTALMDMYAKSGNINAALSIFQNMKDKNTVSWNSIIGGVARHGLGTRALEMFNDMIKEHVRPDEVTFVNVLYACGQGGLVERGEEIFKEMNTKYGINAELEHFACMVDLYGKAGQLEKAEKVIKEMKIEPDEVVWGAFLGACAMHSNLEMVEFAVEGIRRVRKDHVAVCSMFMKVYTETGSWSEVIKLKRRIQERRVRKQKAGSWVENNL